MAKNVSYVLLRLKMTPAVYRPSVGIMNIQVYHVVTCMGNCMAIIYKTRDAIHIRLFSTFHIKYNLPYTKMHCTINYNNTYVESLSLGDENASWCLHYTR